QRSKYCINSKGLDEHAALLPMMEAGPLQCVWSSLVCLAAEEGRNVELILLRGIMHRRGAAVRIKALRRSPARVFGHGVGRPPFRLTRTRPDRTLVLWSGRAGLPVIRLAAPAEADVRKPLHQCHALLLGMI